MASLLLAWALMTASSRPYTADILEVADPGGGAGPGRRIEVPELDAAPYTLLWTPDGRHVWADGDEQVFRVDAATGAVVQRLRLPDDDSADGLALAPGGRRVAASTLDGFVVVWDTASGQVLLRAGREGWYPEEFVAFSPDGAQVFAFLFEEDAPAFRDERMAMQAWDIATGKSLGAKRIHEPRPAIEDLGLMAPVFKLAGSHVMFSEFGLHVRRRPPQVCGGAAPFAVAGEVGWYDGDVVGVLRLDDCKRVRTSRSLSAASPVELAITPDGARAAYSRRTADALEIAVIDVATDVRVDVLALPDDEELIALALAPDGSQVAATLQGRERQGRNTLLLWRPDPPTLVVSLHAPPR